MPLIIERNDITKMQVDAIVNAANSSLLGGGGVDGAIHRAAGPQLLEECRTLGGCMTGMAKITKGYRLPAKYVIHTVGPVYQDGRHGEKDALTSCYRNSLLLAETNHCETIAFPLISSGIYGYPKDQALQVAVDTIHAFLNEHDMTVYLVLFDKSSFQLGTKVTAELKEYIDDNYVDMEQHHDVRRSTAVSAPMDYSIRAAESSFLFQKDEASLENIVDQVDESFSQMLLRKIDEKKMTDAECYKKANVDRKLFSKIRSDVLYQPSKQTALAFAIALELSLSETQDMLMKAGYALSHSSKADLVIEYYIKHHNYNVYEINEALFAFDQKLLGM